MFLFFTGMLTGAVTWTFIVLFLSMIIATWED